MSYRLISVAAYGSAAVSTEVAKDFMRVEHSAEDTLIDTTIEVATRFVEQRAGLALREQTWTLTLDNFPAGPIELPGGTVSAVNSVTYYDQDNQAQTLAPSSYLTLLTLKPAVVETLSTNVWPTTYKRRGAVQIEYVTGSGTPEPGLIQAVKMMAAHLYENREAAISTATPITKVPLGFEELISAHAVGWYG